jgi:hypothetical protein
MASPSSSSTSHPSSSPSSRASTPAAPVYGVRRVRWLELADTLNALAQAGATILAVLEQASGSVFENQVGIVYHAEKVIPEASAEEADPEPHEETVVATGVAGASQPDDDKD